MIPTIYTLTYNEELLIQFMIDHYRSRFPNCPIIIYDNASTDNTASIALKNNCKVIDYSDRSGHQLDDVLHRDIKNSCWKSADTEWVLVCDLDELVEINDKDLDREDAAGTTLIQFEGYHMVNMEENFDLSNIKYGVRAQAHDKSYLFKKSQITDINYDCGAHHSSPVGNVKVSDQKYTAYHYKFLNTNYILDKLKAAVARMCDNNKKTGMGHYSFRSDDGVRQDFEYLRKNSIKVKE